jgi:hypothetical protein
MALHPALLSALTDGSALRVFIAVRFDLLNDTTINLIDGSGFISFAVDGVMTNFDGDNPTYGTLAAVTSIKEQVASEAPTVAITLFPPSAAATGEINQPELQGSMCRIWFGLVDEMTGSVYGEPELLWTGRLDTVKTNLSGNVKTVEIEVASAFDRLFAVEEGDRLNKTWHQNIWPGETGLNQNIKATIDPFWGTEATRPSVTPAGYYGGNSSTGVGGLIERMLNRER